MSRLLAMGTILALFALASPFPARAEDLPQEKPEAKECPTKLVDESRNERLLSGNEPSYFVPIAHDDGSDESHVEFFVSIKYPLARTYVKHWLGCGADLYFNYNGKYDFYVYSRDSSPIISRKQNPGLMFEYTMPNERSFHLESLKTGYFHESNGQTIDTREEYLATSEHAGDYVSRGWDYIPLEANFALSEYSSDYIGDFFLNLQTRYFMDRQMFREDREDRIFWEDVDEQPRIEQYDGVRATLSAVITLPYNATKKINFKAIYRSGYREFNLSQRYEATFHLLEVPLYIFYFRGYGVELSTYHQKGTTFGIGFEFR